MKTPEQPELWKQLAKFLTHNSPEEKLPFAELEKALHLVMEQEVTAVFLARLTSEQEAQLAHLPLFQKIRQELFDQTAQLMLQEHALLEITQKLHNAGIKIFWLKGASLSSTVYSAPFLRPMGDLDGIVPASQYHQAIQIVHGLGYQEDLFPLKMPFDFLLHHTHLVHTRFPTLHIEIHHKLLGHLGEQYLPIQHIERWMQEPYPFQINNNVLYTFQPEYHFLYLCAHALLQHGAATLHMRHWYDLYLLVTQEDLSWGKIIEEAIILKWTTLIELVVAHLETYFDVSIPAFVTQDLAKNRPHDEDITMLYRKQSGDIRAENIYSLFHKLSSRQKIQALIAILFPPTRYMRWRYQIPEKYPIWIYYPYRWFDQLWGIIHSLGKRTR